MEDDLGESEIIEPLQAVLKLPTIDGYLRQVFVITAGVVNQIRTAAWNFLYLLDPSNHTGFQ